MNVWYIDLRYDSSPALAGPKRLQEGWYPPQNAKISGRTGGATKDRHARNQKENSDDRMKLHNVTVINSAAGVSLLF